ncbi:chorismate synthase [Barnesiella viscericola]|uniref:chorismate synthase n=1 Tax=Barnesiella viscericola TaxID=397865 RepID=UPI0024B7EE3F|nr:chorismate synthase [Barnesiella viscericola]
MNTIGKLFTLTSFGESHGSAIGGVVDGMPAGIPVDMEFIQQELDRRRPGQSSIVTPRKESDRVEFLSGVFEGKTTGTPIGFVVRNENQHSSDYDNLRDLYRPSHADYTYQCKYGCRDHRGGGRSSARETIARCVAGALAKLVLRHLGIEVWAYTSQVGELSLPGDYRSYDRAEIEKNAVRCPDAEMARQMEAYIARVKSEGDTVGGVITGVISGVPAGLGEPVFNKLHAALGSAMLGINAVKGFEYGMGFAGARCRGSQVNDVFESHDGRITTRTNYSGGIQGGISNGEDIYFRVAFKPVATLLRDIETVDTQGNPVVLKAKGRHDPCVLPRAVPVVEAMAAMVILDYYLLAQSHKL